MLAQNIEWRKNEVKLSLNRVREVKATITKIFDSVLNRKLISDEVE